MTALDGRPGALGAATARRHIGALVGALGTLDTGRLDAWGQRLAVILGRGGRLLVAGNGGSAAQAQHLTAEFTGRFFADRKPYSAIALHADTSAVTAIGNDYGYEEVFARQVAAHGRPGDVLLAMSTSGRSPNLLRAVSAARECELACWALTGPAPNPLVDLCDRAVSFPGRFTATVQELQLVALHVICAAVDREVVLSGAQGSREEAFR